jgi:hypothetical protein
MTCFGRPLLAAAVVLMLTSLADQVRTATTGAASADVELVGGKPAYPPCAWAKPGRTCYDGHGISAAGGHRRR